MEILLLQTSAGFTETAPFKKINKSKAKRSVVQPDQERQEEGKKEG